MIENPIVGMPVRMSKTGKARYIDCDINPHGLIGVVMPTDDTAVNDGWYAVQWSNRRENYYRKEHLDVPGVSWDQPIFNECRMSRVSRWP